MAIILIHHETSPKAYDDIQRFIFTISLGIPLFIIAQLYAEKYKQYSKWLGYILVTVFMTVKFIFYHHSANDWNILIYIAEMLSANFIICYIYHIDNRDSMNFYKYNVRMLEEFIIGAFYAACLLLGINGAILAINELFDLHIKYNIYLDIFFIVLFVFHPIYVSSKIPIADEWNSLDSDNSKLIYIVLKYILIPFTIIYFLIIYAYGLKLLITWSLPKGWIGKLCIGFSAIGIITYVINYYYYKTRATLIHYTFSHKFFAIIIPIVGLLLFSILYRINQYGITEERYFVLLIGLWLLGITTYYLLSKEADLRLIPMSLSIFCLTGIIGPWNAKNLSLYSQNNRLEKIIADDQLLDTNGKIKLTAISSLDETTQLELYNTIFFQTERNNTSRIDSYFNESTQASASQFGNKNGTSHPYLIAIDANRKLANNIDFLYYSIQDNTINEFKIAEFEFAINFSLPSSEKEKTIKINNDQIIFNNKDTIPVIELFHKNKIEIETTNEANMMFKTEVNNKPSLLRLKYISIKKSNSNNFSIDHMDGTLYYK